MTKTVTSPVKAFPGSVVLTDPLTLPQVIALEEATAEAEELKGTARSWAKARSPLVRPICMVVVEWKLENWPESVSPENFPASPRAATSDLIEWLVDEIARIYLGDQAGGPPLASFEPSTGG